MSSTLESLVGAAGAFWDRHWKRAPLRHHAGLLDLITEAAMLEQLDGGLMSWPSFAVLRDGRPLPREEVTTSRRVLNVTVAGFPQRRAVVDAIGRGATFMLREPEHWCRQIRELVRGLRPAFEARVRSCALLTPEGGVATAAESDGLDMLVVHLSGCTRWTLTGRDRVPVEHALEPGDVLYLPYDTRRRATAEGGHAVHLAVTIEEPGAADVADVVVAEVARRLESNEEARHHHLIPAERKGAWLRDRVIAFHAEIDSAAVARAAVERCTGAPLP